MSKASSKAFRTYPGNTVVCHVRSAHEIDLIVELARMHRIPLTSAAAYRTYLHVSPACRVFARVQADPDRIDERARRHRRHETYRRKAALLDGKICALSRPTERVTPDSFNMYDYLLPPVIVSLEEFILGIAENTEDGL